MLSRSIRGKTIEEEIKEPRYYLNAESGDKRCPDCNPFGLNIVDGWCIHEAMEMDANNWLKAYGRFVRHNYDRIWIDEILATNADITTLIAACLRWADLNPCEHCWEMAANMARTNTISELEMALYDIEERYEYVAAVLALIHYGVLSRLPEGKYIPAIDIEIKNGRYMRKYVAR